MGGELRLVSSKIGQGSTFHASVVLPTALPPVGFSEVPTLPPDLRILVVEDEPINRKVVVDHL